MSNVHHTVKCVQERRNMGDWMETPESSVAAALAVQAVAMAAQAAAGIAIPVRITNRPTIRNAAQAALAGLGPRLQCTDDYCLHMGDTYLMTLK